MARQDWRKIPLWENVTEEQWNNWQWQISNRLTSVEEIKQVVNLTPEEEADIAKVMDGFRVGVTPYYASLIGSRRPHLPCKNAGCTGNQ